MGDGVCVPERSRPRWLRKPPERASGGSGPDPTGSRGPLSFLCRFCAGRCCFRKVPTSLGMPGGVRGLTGDTSRGVRTHWGRLEGCEKSGTPLASVAEVEARSLGGRGLR